MTTKITYRLVLFGLAGDVDTRTSTARFSFIMVGGAITWQSKKQEFVTLSSSEAKKDYGCKLY